MTSMSDTGKSGQVATDDDQFRDYCGHIPCTETRANFNPLWVVNNCRSRKRQETKC